MLDHVISDVTIVDGAGAAPYRGDIGIKDGVIVELGTITSPARERIAAAGAVATPGWVDIHTHYDGQVAWDDTLEPSFSHGVTTIVMGNCGVGFAPVTPGGEARLIDIMEGVEDIPGTALHEGVPWGAWETYPQYLEYLAQREYTMDIGSHIPHGALRVYAMGERGVFTEHANADDIANMAQMVAEGMAAGAMGFSSNRIIGHRALSGAPVPGTFAAEDELMAIAKAMGRADSGVLQMIPGGAMGDLANLDPDPQSTGEEIALMGRLSRASGRPVTYSLFQVPSAPDAWREAMALTDAENAKGAAVYPQIAARPPGILSGLAGYHLFQRRETYLKLREFPFSQRIAAMRDPAVKAAILSDIDIPDANTGSMENLYQFLEPNIGRFYALGDPVDYEPLPERSVAGVARATGQSEQSVLYDFYMEANGGAYLLLAGNNYIYEDHEVIREMLVHPGSLSGLSDAGAHMKFVCDASIPSFALAHWTRDRRRGPKLPVELIVAKLSAANAHVYGMKDRGRIAPGLRADINIIDLDRIRISGPELLHDLPTGAGRLVQPATGYVATMVKGVVTRRNDQDTGARPGRLLRGR